MLVITGWARQLPAPGAACRRRRHPSRSHGRRGGELQRRPQPLEPVGLVGPHAGLQPAPLVGVVDVDRRAVEPAALDDLGHRRRHGHPAPRPALQVDRRRAADLAAGDVGVVVSVEQQVQPGARADVEVGERADLGGEHPERRQEQGAAPDLVGLRAARRQQLLQLGLVRDAERPQRRQRITVAGRAVKLGYHRASCSSCPPGPRRRSCTQARKRTG